MVKQKKKEKGKRTVKNRRKAGEKTISDGENGRKSCNKIKQREERKQNNYELRKK